MSKRNTFEMTDLALLIPSVLCVSLAAVSWVVEFRNPDQAMIMRSTLTSSAILFTFIGFMAIRSHRRRMNQFQWIATHNIFFDAGGTRVKDEQVKLVYERVVHIWENEIKWPVQKMLADNALFISFRRLPMVGLDGKNSVGYHIPKSFEVVIGINDGDTVHDTTLEHELNHIFCGQFTQNWDEDYHHSFFHEYGFK